MGTRRGPSAGFGRENGPVFDDGEGGGVLRMRLRGCTESLPGMWGIGVGFWSGLEGITEDLIGYLLFG